MSTTRRDFLKAAAILSGIGATGVLPESIRRALAIEPAPGSTFLDAEHVVILMQENRSFDHTFGTLRGVRGFNDPRAITLPDGNPVWAQPDASGKRFVPFRLNIKDTKATWMGSLPHSWPDQVDARNDGRYDRWLAVKHSGDDAYAGMPLTLGYYTRADIPYYYALADAFTVCDQNFCSALTGTTPNRLHLWTGTIRAEPSADAFAHVQNADVDYGREAHWKTFPERLQEHGIAWKIYQNELSLDSGLAGEHNAWLANFTDNPIEWFSQYQVRFAASRRRYVRARIDAIPGEIAATRTQLASAAGQAKDKLEKQLAHLKRDLAEFQKERDAYSQERYDALPESQRRLHERAFCTSAGDPDYRELIELSYRDGDIERKVLAPRGDVLFQFRKDVSEGALPTVSWLVPPERFSDHPGSAWYGAWYVAEVLDILTKNPAIWKKTVFILTYDENDGYFDHVPPFVAPDPERPETGRVSKGIDTGPEWVGIDQDRIWHPGGPRNSPIGLGYRVPMIIASPWSRGGAVCSQVFDHTSVLMFLEKFLSHKTGAKVVEPNISAWRRTICGDLTSAFKAPDDAPAALQPLDRDQFVEQIHRAKFKGLPRGYRALTDAELAELRQNPAAAPLLPRQERGIRPSCPLPYELFVSGGVDSARARLALRFEARNDLFREKTAGAPFTAYAFTKNGGFSCRNYAVAAGATLDDSWPLADFPDGVYRVRVYAPNGCFWEFAGSAADPAIDVQLARPSHAGESPATELVLAPAADFAEATVSIRDNSYGAAPISRKLTVGDRTLIRIATAAGQGWYDFTMTLSAAPHFQRRFAGRLESGAWGVSDPRMDAPA